MFAFLKPRRTFHFFLAVPAATLLISEYLRYLPIGGTTTLTVSMAAALMIWVFYIWQTGNLSRRDPHIRETLACIAVPTLIMSAANLWRGESMVNWVNLLTMAWVSYLCLIRRW